MAKRTGLKITNIDFSDWDGEETLKFEIEHDECSPVSLWLRILRQYADGVGPNCEIDTTITLTAGQMKALGKALVFAAEYVEGLYSKDGHNF